MTSTQAQTLLAILVSTVTLSTVMWRAIHSVAKKYLLPTLQVVDDWRGDPGRPEEGIPARDGVLKRLTRVETASVETRSDLTEFRQVLTEFRQDLLMVKQQVTTNGGSSMLDRVNQTYDVVTQNAHTTIGVTP